MPTGVYPRKARKMTERECPQCLSVFRSRHIQTCCSQSCSAKYKWMKEGYREHQSKAHRNVVQSVESRRKRSEQMSGENHPQWQGGKTKEDTRIRHSLEYRLWREAVFKRDDFTCQACGVRGIYLEADHIKPFARHPELRFEVTNGRSLCRPCHKETETWFWKISPNNLKKNI